jgi:hypothetical protein
MPHDADAHVPHTIEYFWVACSIFKQGTQLEVAADLGS